MSIPPRAYNGALIESPIHSLGHISILPADVMLNIFLLIRRVSDEGYCLRKEYIRRHPIATTLPSESWWDWLILTKICRHWRAIAMEGCSLWSEIHSFRHIDKIRTFLERSGRVHLKLHLDISDDVHGREIISLLEGHMWRAREIKVHVYRAWDLLTPRLLDMSECTKVLELYHEPYLGHANKHLNDVFHETKLSKIVDVLPSIQLQSLSLQFVNIPWSNFVLYDLMELNIASLPFQTTRVPTLLELLNVLEHCPRLRNLRLESLWPLFENNDADLFQTGDHKVTLPHLESLLLDEISFPALSFFFKAISISATAHLKITCGHYPISDPIRLPTEVLRGRKPCDSINVKFGNYAFNITSGYNHNGDAAPPNASIVIKTYDMDEGCIKAASVIGLLLEDLFWRCADGVTVLFSNDDQPNLIDKYLNSWAWAIIFGGLPNVVERLTIELPNLYNDYYDGHLTLPAELLEALARLPFDPGTATGTVLPLLKQLKICNADLTTERQRIMVNLLMRHMEKRVNCTKQVCEVKFVDCKWTLPEQGVVFKPGNVESSEYS